MGFFEKLQEKAKGVLDHYGTGIWEGEDGIDATIEALKEMIAWQADFEGYIEAKTHIKRRGIGMIEGHLTHWKGDELKPTCRLIALRSGGEKDDIPDTDVQVRPETEEEAG